MFYNHQIPLKCLLSNSNNRFLVLLELIIYLWEVSVSNLTLFAFVSSERVTTNTAACVDVTLLRHWADHTAATFLYIEKQNAFNNNEIDITR